MMILTVCQLAGPAIAVAEARRGSVELSVVAAAASSAVGASILPVEPELELVAEPGPVLAVAEVRTFVVASNTQLEQPPAPIAAGKD